MFPRGSGAEDEAASALGAMEAVRGRREPREAAAREGRLVQVQPHHPPGSGRGWGRKSARSPRQLCSGSLRETLPSRGSPSRSGEHCSGRALGSALSGSLKQGGALGPGGDASFDRLGAREAALVGKAARSQELGPQWTLDAEISGKSPRGVGGSHRVPGSPWQRQGRGRGGGLCAPGFPRGIW